MGCFEYVYALRLRMPCGDYQPRCGFPEPPFSHHFRQALAKGRRIVFRPPEQPSAGPVPAGKPARNSRTRLREDCGAFVFVNLEDFCCAHSKREPNGDNAAGGRARDQVKILADRQIEVLLQIGQKRRRKRAPNTTAVDR